MKVVFLFSLFVASCTALSSLEVVAQEWEEWKVTHTRNYTSTIEEKFRFKIFMENKAKISKHNYHAQLGRQSYFLRMNHYGDLLSNEFATLMNGYRKLTSAKIIGATFIPAINVNLPDSIDWRLKGAVTPVKDQGQCGSCWSFSATGALEGQDYRKTGELISLSEQNLIDCSAKYGNNGCNGGLMDSAFTYIKENKGIDTEASYPYEAKNSACRYSPANKGGSDVGFVDIPPGDEQALKHAIGTIGPVSVAIDASHQSFQFYSHGVYGDKECSSEELDHGVLAVGYGVDKHSNMDYWLVKNSWSEKWGDKGYIKIARNKNNMCGIASAASYPLV